MNTRIALSVILWLSLLAAGPSLAQEAISPGAELARQTLIKEAQAAQDCGDHAKAFDLARRAAAIRVTPSLRYMIAVEAEALGFMAEAYWNAQRCRSEAERTSASVLNARDSLIRECKKIEQRLTPRMAYVRVEATLPAAPGLAVTINGETVPPSAYGIPYPVAPGTVTIGATAPGKAPSEQKVEAKAGETLAVAVTLVDAPPAAVPPVAVKACPDGERREGDRCVRICAPGTVAQGELCVPANPDVARPAPPPPPPPPPGPRRTRDVRGLFVAGAGVAAVALATVSWLIADAEFNETKDTCAGGACTGTDIESSASKVQRFDRVAQASLGVGGALIIGGGLWYFFGGQDESSERAQVSVDPVRRMVSLRWKLR